MVFVEAGGQPWPALAFHLVLDRVSLLFPAGQARLDASWASWRFFCFHLLSSHGSMEITDVFHPMWLNVSSQDLNSQTIHSRLFVLLAIFSAFDIHLFIHPFVYLLVC